MSALSVRAAEAVVHASPSSDVARWMDKLFDDAAEPGSKASATEMLAGVAAQNAVDGEADIQSEPSSPRPLR